MSVKHEEWQDLELVEDLSNPFCSKYVYPTKECFYIEPIFYTMLMGFKQRHANQFQLILDEIRRIVKNNRKVVFTGEFETPLTKATDDYIYLEIFDVTDKLGIFVEDKSRGSDYGD